MASQVLVLVGTRKGGFIVESDGSRKSWNVKGPYCAGRQTLHMSFDPATGAILAATAGSGGNGLFEGFGVKCPQCGAEQFQPCTEDGAPIKDLHARRKPPTGVWRTTDLGETWAF